MEKNIEFEEMKQQLHILQQRLDKQVEINDKQTRRAIKDGIGSLSKKDRREIFVNLFALIFVPAVTIFKGLSTPFVVATFTFILGLNMMKYLYRFDNRTLSEMSLIETARYLLKYKKNSRNNLLFGFPFAILWLFWFAQEISHIPPFDGYEMTTIYLELSICSVVGLIIGLKLFYFNQMHAANRLLRQIEDVQIEK